MMKKLKESGAKDRLKTALRQRLDDCGWTERLRDHIGALIASEGQLSPEQLVERVLGDGWAAPPEDVVQAMQERIRAAVRKSG